MLFINKNNSSDYNFYDNFNYFMAVIYNYSHFRLPQLYTFVAKTVYVVTVIIIIAIIIIITSSKMFLN